MSVDDLAGRLATRLAVPRQRLTPDTCLVDLAADSLDLVELLLDLEEELGVTLTQADLATVRTLGDLAALLRSRRQPHGGVGDRDAAPR